MIKELGYYLFSRAQAFHDDYLLKEYIDKTIWQLGIRSFVETGTYRGRSSCYIADIYPSVRVYTIEKYIPYRVMNHVSVKRRNLTRLGGDSAEVLPALLEKIEGPVMFWLDAHHGSRMPLFDELDAIFLSDKPSFVIIDDFEVPGQPSFASWSYNGKPLSWNMIEHHVPPITRIEYPTYTPRPGSCGWVSLHFPGFGLVDVEA